METFPILYSTKPETAINGAWPATTFSYNFLPDVSPGGDGRAQRLQEAEVLICDKPIHHLSEIIIFVP